MEDIDSLTNKVINYTNKELVNNYALTFDSTEIIDALSSKFTINEKNHKDYIFWINNLDKNFIHLLLRGINDRITIEKTLVKEYSTQLYSQLDNRLLLSQFKKNININEKRNNIINHVIDYKLNTKISRKELEEVIIEDDLGLIISGIDKEVLISNNRVSIAKLKNYVLKAKKVELFDYALHEYFIGINVINNYKGFVKIISFRIQYKHNDGLYSCILMEYIQGKSLTEWIKQDNPKHRLYKILLQIVENLYSINKDTGFTHYDMHTDNIIIKEDDTPIIIDFERSYCMYNNKHYGYSWKKMNIECKSNWISDVFRLLMYCYLLIFPEDYKVKEIKNKVYELSEMSKKNLINDDYDIKNIVDYFNIFYDKCYNEPINEYKFYNKFNSISIEIYRINIMLIIRKLLNSFLNKCGFSLDEYNYKYINIESYEENFGPYFIPTKSILEANKDYKFEDFVNLMKSFEDTFSIIKQF